MNALIKKARLLYALILLFLFLYALQSAYQRDRKFTINEFGLTSYEGNRVILHKYLFEIYNLTAHNRIDEAENTFLDMRQLWSIQDVLIKPVQGQISGIKYFPSDSLAKLEKLIKLMHRGKSNKHLANVMQEIRRIEGCLDKSESLLNKR